MIWSMSMEGNAYAHIKSACGIMHARACRDSYAKRGWKYMLILGRFTQKLALNCADSAAANFNPMNSHPNTLMHTPEATLPSPTPA